MYASIIKTDSLFQEGLCNYGVWSDLTRAERRVLNCLVHGMSNQEMAGSLFVSLETIKSHIQSILAKLKVDTRTQAALMGQKDLFTQMIFQLADKISNWDKQMPQTAAEIFARPS